MNSKNHIAGRWNGPVNFYCKKMQHLKNVSAIGLFHLVDLPNIFTP